MHKKYINEILSNLPQSLVDIIISYHILTFDVKKMECKIEYDFHKIIDYIPRKTTLYDDCKECFYLNDYIICTNTEFNKVYALDKNLAYTLSLKNSSACKLNNKLYVCDETSIKCYGKIEIRHFEICPDSINSYSYFNTISLYDIDMINSVFIMYNEKPHILDVKKNTLTDAKNIFDQLISQYELPNKVYTKHNMVYFYDEMHCLVWNINTNEFIQLNISMNKIYDANESHILTNFGLYEINK